MKWFKFYGQDYLSDPKILALSACERSCWITLLSYGSVNDNGLITFLDEEQLMAQSGISPMHDEWEQTKGVLEKLNKLKMITVDNGMITILNWEKRQGTALTGYERLKKYREKKRINNNDNKMITKDETQMITIEENRIEENRIESCSSTTNDIKNSLLKEKKEPLKMTEDDFNTFWDLYPRRVGKKTAYARFMKLSPDKLPLILEAIKKQSLTEQWKNPQFIPHPSTWLNQERWEDQVEQSVNILNNERVL